MPLTHNADKVWFDEAHKLEQLRADVAAFKVKHHNVLLLSHFEATLRKLGVLLRERYVDHELFFSLHPSELCASSYGKVWLGLASALAVPFEMAATNGVPLEILVAEHHPFWSRDQAIVDAATKLACGTELTFYFSLDDPVMKHFGAEAVKALFERLGIEKSECVSHHLINTSIRTAQEKIERKVGKDVPTQSPEDWFKYNLPGKR